MGTKNKILNFVVGPKEGEDPMEGLQIEAMVTF